MAIPLIESILTPQRSLPGDRELVHRAEYLDEPDRLLMEAVIMEGQSINKMAKVMGIWPGALRKRFFVLKKRLRSREYVSATKALRYLSENDASLARLHYCLRVPQRRLREKFCLSSYALRTRLENLKAQIEMIGRMVENARDLRDIPLPASDGRRRPA